MTLSSNLSESVVARETTDLVKKGLTAIASAAGASVANGASDVDGYLNELAYHKVFGTNKAAFALSNTSIPKVISGTATDFSYVVKITEQAIGSDPVSLLRVQELYCKVVPLITPISDGARNTVVPRSPLYVSAFVKGVMNVPRGAITSINVSTNPSFQTSEGIPTVMDIELTIQPLMAISVIPDMGRFFARSDDAAIVASMYNPMSAFNVLSTMCGYNTVLSKFPHSLFNYFVSGNVTSFFNSLKGTSNYIHSVTNDFIASRNMLLGTSMSTK